METETEMIFGVFPHFLVLDIGLSSIKTMIASHNKRNRGNEIGQDGESRQGMSGSELFGLSAGSFRS